MSFIGDRILLGEITSGERETETHALEETHKRPIRDFKIEDFSVIEVFFH